MQTTATSFWITGAGRVELASVTDLEIVKHGAWGGDNDSVSAPSTFIANGHNQLCAFYTGKDELLKKNSENNSGRAATPTPFESAIGSPWR